VGTILAAFIYVILKLSNNIGKRELSVKIKRTA
jgi:hypothetical protein